MRTEKTVPQFKCKRDIDLMIKNRLNKVVQSRYDQTNRSFDGSLWEFVYDNGSDNSFSLTIQAKEDGLIWASYDVWGPCECMNYYYFPRNKLGFDTIVYMLHMVNEEDGTLSKLDMDLLDELVGFDDGDDDLTRVLITEFYNAYKLAYNGNPEDALFCEEFYSFCASLSEFCGIEDLPLEFVASNLYALVEPFAIGSENNIAVCYALCSKELFAYDRYKDRLPLSIKEKIDYLVDVVENPFSEGCGGYEHFSVQTAGDYRVILCNFAKDSENPIRRGSVDGIYFNVMFNVAWKTLHEELPQLRKQYDCSKDDEHSSSKAA